MDRYCVIVWGVELNRVRNNKRATCWVVILDTSRAYGDATLPDVQPYQQRVCW